MSRDFLWRALLSVERPQERILTLREFNLANGIDESASVVVDYGMVSLMSEFERVTEMRDLSTSVRTRGMRECRDHLKLALISSAGTSLSTVLDCWS